MATKVGWDTDVAICAQSSVFAGKRQRTDLLAVPFSHPLLSAVGFDRGLPHLPG